MLLFSKSELLGVCETSGKISKGWGTKVSINKPQKLEVQAKEVIMRTISRKIPGFKEHICFILMYS